MVASDLPHLHQRNCVRPQIFWEGWLFGLNPSDSTNRNLHQASGSTKNDKSIQILEMYRLAVDFFCSFFPGGLSFHFLPSTTFPKKVLVFQGPAIVPTCFLPGFFRHADPFDTLTELPQRKHASRRRCTA